MEAHLLFAILPIFARCLGMLAILPIPWDLLGLAQRLTLSLGLGIFLTPVTGDVQPFSFEIVLLNFVIGLLVSLPTVLIVDSALMLGELFDAARGQTIAQAYDPGQQSTIPVTSSLAQHFSWAMLVSLGLFNSLILSLRDSLVHIDLQAEYASLHFLGASILPFAVAILSRAFLAVVPILGIFLCIELALGFLAKGLNGIGLIGEGFVLKLIFGTGLLMTLSHFELGVALSQVTVVPWELIAVK